MIRHAERPVCFIIGVTSLCLATLCNCGVPEMAQQTTPTATGDGLAVSPEHERGLRDALAAMIALLEGGKHLEFLETYADPELVVQARQDGTLEEMAARMAGPDGADLLRSLQAARSMRPRFGPEETTATFWQDGFPRYLVLRQVDGRWRVMN